jgi:predicted esterase
MRKNQTGFHVMAIDRRGFLSAAAASIALAAARDRAHAQSSGQIPGPPGEPTPGRARWLGLGTDGRDGLLYVPPTFTRERAWPLLVILHGAGGSSMSTQYVFPYADERGFLVLAPDSRNEVTWDVLLGEWGSDAPFIAGAMRYAMRACPIDKGHVGLAGFSDGASYALSMGIGAGDVFSRIMAMSPGVMQPMAVNGKPRIFISHGTRDPVMPIDITSRRFVPKLKALGYDVTYREYDGRHELPPPVAREAFEWFTAR